MHQQLWGYKVEDKLDVGVREQKKFEYHWSIQSYSVVSERKHQDERTDGHTDITSPLWLHVLKFLQKISNKTGNVL
jgi:hypothetical protein